MSLLVISEILGLFVNTLTANDKYSLHNIVNLRKSDQMELYKKQKTFSQFSAPFLKSSFEKDDPNILCIPDITDCENVVRKMSQKYHFRTQFDNQHAKRSRTLLRSERQYLYHILLFI